jgi:hypothetical protein
MHADVEHLRPGHGELVEISAHHDAAAERALVGIEYEALRRVGVAGVGVGTRLERLKIKESVARISAP